MSNKLHKSKTATPTVSMKKCVKWLGQDQLLFFFSVASPFPSLPSQGLERKKELQIGFSFLLLFSYYKQQQHP